MNGYQRRVLVTGAVCVLGAICVAPALAVDGVIEINQACAVNTGCFSGDGAGFPVTISESGSYRLTGDLDLTASPVSDDGVRISASDVTLDLNGFSIVGDGGPNFADGIGILGNSGSRNVEARNGTVRNFGRHGVFSTGAPTEEPEGVRIIGLRAIGNGANGIRLEGEGNLVDGCVAVENGGYGIAVFYGSLVINSVSRKNIDEGVLALGSGYRSNVITENNGGNANPQVQNGVNLGSNLCGTDTNCP